MKHCSTSRGLTKALAKILRLTLVSLITVMGMAAGQ